MSRADFIAFLEKNFRIKRWERHELAGKAQAPWLWLPPQPKRRNAARRLVSPQLFRKGFLRIALVLYSMPSKYKEAAPLRKRSPLSFIGWKNTLVDLGAGLLERPG